MSRNLRQLLQELNNYEIIGEGDPEISSISYDSRKAKAGSLFFAIPGFKSDGTDFIPDAISHGASAVVAQKHPQSSLNIPLVLVPDIRRFMAELAWVLFNHPEKKLTPIAVTGTNGKTTVATLLSSILSLCDRKCGLVGTLGVFDGNKDLETFRTTPESADLAQYFHSMLEAGCTHVVMEATSIGIELKRTWGIPFQIAIFTNLTRDHIDFHQTMEAYREAKLELFRGLEPSSIAVINLDDPSSAQFIAACPCKVVTYSIEHEADVQATDLKLTREAIHFTLVVNGEKTKIIAPLIGKFNVHNILAVIGAAASIGIPLDTIAEAFKDVKPVRGRAEIIPSLLPFTVIVDYAHTPDALEKILETLQGLEHHKILTIIGAGGDRDRGKRPQMAEIAYRLSDHLFLTSDNPRSEDPESILDEMAAGLPVEAQFHRIADRKRTIHTTLTEASAGDIVLIAGKGHETYQEINGVKYPFDDREIALEWLSKAGQVT